MLAENNSSKTTDRLHIEKNNTQTPHGKVGVLCHQVHWLSRYLRACSGVSWRDADETQWIWVGSGCWNCPWKAELTGQAETWPGPANPSQWSSPSEPFLNLLKPVSEAEPQKGFLKGIKENSSEREKKKEMYYLWSWQLNTYVVGNMLKPRIFRKAREYSVLPPNSAKVRLGWL